MRRLPITASLLLIGACATVPDTAHSPAASAETPASSTEQLIAQPPRGWRQTGATNIGNLKRAEFVPEAESVEGVETNWIRRITFESIREDPMPDPIEFVELMSFDRDYMCGTFEAHPTFSGEENGYPTAVFLLVCHKDRVTERSEITMMKTIQGNDFFYVITRSLRGEPIEPGEKPEIEEAVIGGWSLFLKSISVCDPGQPETHPCP